MTTYYVSASGNNTTGLSTATAKTTISAAALLAVAGDTVNVLSGNYNGAIYISTSYNDGTAANPITLKSSPRLAARIVALGAPAVGGGNDAMIEIRADGWTLDGFEVTAEDGYDGSNAWTLGGAGQYRCGIFLTGKDCIAQYNTVHHICQADPGGSGGSGIQSEGFYVSYAAQNNYIRYNIVHHCASSLTSNKSHGIYITGSTNFIHGNLVYALFGGCLIHGWHGFTGGSIINNTVFNCTNVGILVGQGDGGAGAGVASLRCFNNIMRDCNVGIDEQGAITVPRNLYSNNSFFNCTTNYAINTTSTAVTTLTVDQKFVNYVAAGTGDYHLSLGSTLIGGGLASLSGQASPTLDLDGVTRPVNTTWDIGAYEFVGGDVTAPNLTLPTGAATGATTATGGATTDEGNGIMYCWVTTNATETASNVVTNGTTTAIASTGVKSLNISGLNSNTTYYAHTTQVDAAANTATVVNSTSFTTDAPAGGINYSHPGGYHRKAWRRR